MQYVFLFFCCLCLLGCEFQFKWESKQLGYVLPFPSELELTSDETIVCPTLEFRKHDVRCLDIEQVTRDIPLTRILRITLRHPNESTQQKTL